MITKIESDIKKPKIVNLYKEGKTLEQIKKELKTSEKFILKTLKEFKIPRRKHVSAWLEEEELWLKENYALLGPTKCAKILNKKPDAASYKARMLGLNYEYIDRYSQDFLKK